MTKWYFYNNNEISDSLSIEEIKAYIQDNPNAYGWNSSLTQWLPINIISEFTEFITTAPKALGEIPKALVDEFQAKKKKSEQMVNRLENEISQTEQSFSELNTQIERYKKLTLNLSSELKDNIVGMDKQYSVASKKLTLLISALDIAKSEIQDAVTEFNENDMAYTAMPVITEKAPNKDKKTSSKAGEVVEKESHNKVTPEKVSSINKQEKTDETQSQNKDEQAEDVAGGKALNVKSMFKSVFKGNEGKPATLSVSERLKQAEKANAEKAIYENENGDKAPNKLKVWL